MKRVNLFKNSSDELLYVPFNTIKEFVWYSMVLYRFKVNRVYYFANQKYYENEEGYKQV